MAALEQDAQQVQGKCTKHRFSTFVTAEVGCFQAWYLAHKCCMCAQPVCLHTAACVSIYSHSHSYSTHPGPNAAAVNHSAQASPMPAARLLTSLTALQVTQHWVSSTADKLVDLLHQATMSCSMVAAEGTVLAAWRCLVSLAHDLLGQAADANPASSDGVGRDVGRHLLLRMMPLVQQGPLSRRLAFTGDFVARIVNADGLQAPQDLS